MNSYFKPIPGQKSSQRLRNSILSLWHKVKRGTEPQSNFQVSQFKKAIQTPLTFHIVGKNKCKLFTVRPARPLCWHVTRCIIDRPRLGASPPQSVSQNAPQH